MLRCVDPLPMTATLTRPRRWTYADYCRIPADGLRHEILDGEHVVTPSPELGHQAVSKRLLFQLMQKVERKGRARCSTPTRRAPRSRHDRAAGPAGRLPQEPFDPRRAQGHRRARPADRDPVAFEPCA